MNITKAVNFFSMLESLNPNTEVEFTGGLKITTGDTVEKAIAEPVKPAKVRKKKRAVRKAQNRTRIGVYRDEVCTDVVGEYPSIAKAFSTLHIPPTGVQYFREKIIKNGAQERNGYWFNVL